MKKLTKVARSIFYPNRKNTYLFLSGKNTNFLKRKKNLSKSKSRICSHLSIKEKTHEMIIYHKKGVYVRPHKHINKKESFHLINGQADLVVFKNNGEISNVVSLGNYKSKNFFYYKMLKPSFHTLIMREDTLFHEVTSGPFKRKDTLFPSWAPNEKNKNDVKNYLKKLNKLVKTFKQKRSK